MEKGVTKTRTSKTQTSKTQTPQELKIKDLPLFSLIRDFGKQNTHGKFPPVLSVIDKLDRNPPITAR